MIDSTRGPYSRLRWFCNDGTTQPPVEYACGEHGGGRQHAEYSVHRQRLAELGWSVGTIFAPLTLADMLAAAPRAQRLRELPLERYLIDVDDGWILRKAQYYRGRVQLEDEQAAGRQLLLDLLADSDWTSDNYLLARELVRVVPHGEDSDLARRVRRAAVELAEHAPAMERWRAEIHSAPSQLTATRLRDAAAKLSDPKTVDMARALANNLDALYGGSGRDERTQRQLRRLRSKPAREWRESVLRALADASPESVAGICTALLGARRDLVPVLDASERLIVLDALTAVEAQVQQRVLESPERVPRARGALLADGLSLAQCTYGAGLISAGELVALERTLAAENTDEPLALTDYSARVAQLARVPAWAAGTVRYQFAEALIRYGALDPRAVRFTDDLLRGSPLWLLGDVLRQLSQDVYRLSGNAVLIAGTPVSTAIPLNPGIARGRLRIFETLDAAESATTSTGDIVALPETIAELQPVAGILTLGEGNALSHVQLLARNFGIPNVAIDFSTIDLLKPLEGQEVIMAVSSTGSVVVRAASDVAQLDVLFPAGAKSDAARSITVPPPDLAQTEILPLAEIGRHLSGKIIGPKAANLGELNRLFPGRVAPALAIPFGVYANHLESQGLRDRINVAYAAHALGELSPGDLDTELTAIREAIARIELDPDTRAALLEIMADEFGAPDTYGVFVRSDTNVEDLPQFTGAGLSETVPNVVGAQRQLASIARVWASVLSPRALAWRSSLLTNPEQVFASVLLMKSVPSDKSGVLVTANLANPGRDGLTVSTAWGVGGAVAGEAAESLVLNPEGSVQLLSEAKTPFRRRLATAGGVDWVAASSGPVLTDAEVSELRKLAAEVQQKYVPVLDERGRPRPWDIEFGFVQGELTLFQIRPLVEKSTQRADRAIELLGAPATADGSNDETVDLTRKPLETGQ